jgi:hypothetical protein
MENRLLDFDKLEYPTTGGNIFGSITDILLKLFVAVILMGIVFYSFMLILKLRVLQDTVEMSTGNVAKIAITVNLIVTIGGTVLAFILILL